jgi:signal transduction histidine kinase
VQRLADTFDAMLDRLNAAFQQQRNFVLDVSHELRTPLTALRGNLDVLLMHEDLGTEARAQLERMSMEVGRLIRLTSNLLYLAHVDAGRGVDRRPVAMDDLCLEVYRQAKDLRPEVRLRLGGEDQVTVMGDRDLLKQLILNLVDNGLKYTPPGGEVTLSLYAEDFWARIVVEDTGPGIPPEDLPHIFDRYYRGAGSGGRGGSGAGIGLAIAEWVARAHGGRIEVDSEVGKGSTFTVHLPLDSGPAASSGGGAGV